MKNRFLLFLLLTNGLFSVHAQNLNLAAFLISDTLLQNADAVIRFHHTEINRLSAGKAVMNVHFAVTVLNKNGQQEAWLALHYDNNRKVESLRGKYYNELGLEIDKVKKDDISDFSSYPDFTFYSDSRVKLLKPIRKQYPYTAEYEYEIELNGLVGFDIWMPVSNEGVALEQANLSISFDEKFPVSYKSDNGDFDFLENKSGKFKSYKWSITNVPAYTQEPFMPAKRGFLPWVMLAPVSFEYEKTEGNFENWKNYGLWVYNLLKERDEVPQKTRAEIVELLKGDTNTKTSIQKIYQYMQQNTRYVNISMGIGGFQPIAAEDVDLNGYGDCKALSNYTRALLKVAGIESFYAEIGNGKERAELFPAFPSVNQTNHVILCVPVENDSIWLECTNQQIPCGYIGNGNVNRKTILIGDEGGQLVKTPCYTEGDNRTITLAKATINDAGDLSCTAEIKYSGLSCEIIFHPMNLSAKEQKEWLLKNLQPDQVSIKSYAFSDTLTDDYRCSLELNISAPDYATAMGKRLLLEPNIFNKYTSEITKRPERSHDIFVENGYTEIDSLQFVLPKTFRIEHIPENLSDSCLMGTYSISYDTMSEFLNINRKLVIKMDTFSIDHYDEIYRFFKTIDEGDHQKAILLRRE